MPDDDLPPLTEELGKAVIQTELHGESLYKHDEAPGGEKESTSGDGQTVAGVEPTDAMQRSDAQRHNFSLVCDRVYPYSWSCAALLIECLYLKYLCTLAVAVVQYFLLHRP